MKIGVILSLLSVSLTFFVFAGVEHQHGPASGEKLGTVHFPVSCTPAAQAQFDQAVAMLYSFWYEEAEKKFTEVTVTDPNCAMGYWGIAMSLFHPLWATPTPPADLKKGSEALQKTETLDIKTEREKDYIAAVEAYYKDYDTVSQDARKVAFEKAMEKVYVQNPDDPQAAVFYSLSLIATASPKDKTYANQKKALMLLRKVYAQEPDNPGVLHYIIHASDYPQLANMGLDAARSYAKTAPSVPHALHMPSHIFTRLGLWQESIQSNQAAAAAGEKYSQENFAGKAWDQELHPMDYLMYAYLQTGQDVEAKKILDQVTAFSKAQPENNIAAYAFAAMPARYAIEMGQWSAATKIPLHPQDFPWNDFDWSQSVIYFARALGAARGGELNGIDEDLQQLKALQAKSKEANNSYAWDQIQIERLEVDAWLAHHLKKDEEAEKLMRAAAELEDSTEKDNVTPGAIVPARELLGDLLLELQKPQDALTEYETSLKNTPGRLNGIYGAAMAAKMAGNSQKEQEYHSQLAQLCANADGDRPAIRFAKNSSNAK